jgi:hemoglobin-like flavoprotein
MTPTEITLVQDSFRKILPIGDQVASLFYARLFELEPSLRPMFRGNLQEQGPKFMAMVSAAVASLHDVQRIEPVVRSVGPRHAGVAEAYYASFGTALIWTLEKGLGAEFTPAVREAWRATYSLLAITLIHAQREASLPAAASAAPFGPITRS